MFNLNNISNIKGYDTIPKNQKLFKGFLVCFLQSWGIEARETISPISIKFVKDAEGEYLKFVYKIYGKKEWLHVTKNNWY